MIYTVLGGDIEVIHAAFLFPGQGAHYVGMGYSLYNSFPQAKAIFEEADSILGRSLSRICFSGNPSELNRPENMLPAIFVFSIAAYRVVMDVCGVLPVVAAGHSLGEYSALVCSGMLSLEDAMMLIKKRIEYANEVMLSEEAIMMIVDGIPTGIVDDICLQYAQGQVWVGCYNTAEQCVLCGRINSLMNIKELLRDYPVRVTPLFNSPPFHCRMMQCAAEQFKEDLAHISLSNAADFQVISNVTARPYHGGSDIPLLLKEQLMKPVQWKSIINQIKSYDCQCILQIGGRSILTGLGIDNIFYVPTACLNTAEDISKVSRLLRGIPASQSNGVKKQKTAQCLAAVASTRNYNHASVEMQQKIAENYQKLIRLDYAMERQKEHVDMLELRNTLNSIFRAKNIPDQEQHQHMAEIFQE